MLSSSSRAARCMFSPSSRRTSQAGRSWFFENGVLIYLTYIAFVARHAAPPLATASSVEASESQDPGKFRRALDNSTANRLRQPDAVGFCTDFQGRRGQEQE